MTPRAKKARANLIAMGEAMKQAARQPEKDDMDADVFLRLAEGDAEKIALGPRAVTKHWKQPKWQRDVKEGFGAAKEQIPQFGQWAQNNKKLIAGVGGGALALGGGLYAGSKFLKNTARKGALIGGGALAGAGGIGYLAGRGSGGN